MKWQNKKKELTLPSSLRREILLLLLPALIWLAGIYGRPYFLGSACSQAPEACSHASVPKVDQLSLGMENETADLYSYWGQNISGALAMTIPHLWTGISFATGALTPTAALSTVLIDSLLVLQAASWNGMFTETSHYLSRRPRPFVYSDPAVRGIDPSHYTSFYSGHTSFAAAANMAVFFILLFRGAPWYLLLLSITTSEALIFGTGFFRILAGRHFLSDVLVGGLAGILTAWWTVRRFRNGRSFASDS